MDTKQEKKVKSIVQSSTIEKHFYNQNMSSEEEKIHLDGISAFYMQRKYWSYFIMGAIAVIIVFDITLTAFVGCNILNYEKYSWFLEMVIGKTTLEIFGLAFLVVKFLFDKR